MIPLELPDPSTKQRWAAAVSGGADSVAMLLLCREFIGHVVTVDHETRQGESARDAEFVMRLSEQLGLPCSLLKFSELEAGMRLLPRSPQARYRTVRYKGFHTVVEQYGLEGVFTAHHAQDSAETVAQRLIRGSSYIGLSGIENQRSLAKLRVWRPLLRAYPADLREFLRRENQIWREDASNAGTEYARNRIRQALTPELTEALLRLSVAARDYQRVVNDIARQGLREPARTGDFEDSPIGRQRAWLYLSKRVSPAELNTTLVERFVAWSGDAANQAFNLPGGQVLRRRKGQIT